MDDFSTLEAKFQNLTAMRARTEALLARAVANDPHEYDEQLVARLGKSPYLATVRKSTTGALTTGDQGLDLLSPLDQPWVDRIKAVTVIGRGRPRYVPAAQSITTVDTSVAASAVAEGAPIPVHKPTLSDRSLVAYKVATIIPYTNETLAVTGGQVAVLVERDGSRAVAVAEDTLLLDGLAGVAGLRSASVLFGLTSLNGASSTDIEADVLALIAVVRDGEAVTPVFTTSPSGARALIAVRQNGQRVFPNALAFGGDILGIPLLVSAGSPDILALIDMDALLVVDGGIALDTARAAAFQFDTAPSSGAQSVVSLFQTNSTALRIARYIGWKLAVADGAAYMNLETGSPA
jgi:HK97 family phage major capsid protein